MDSNTFEGHRAVKYIGQYKPTRPHALTNGLKILPAGSGMIPYVSGSQVQMNISYLIGPNELSDSALTTAYRAWLTFDAFVLNDHYPIFYFDKNIVGEIETVPAVESRGSSIHDYKQIDYENVAKVMLMTEERGLQCASYSDLFETYQGLPSDLKEMIEWSVSFPSHSPSRLNSFSNLNYWQLFHSTILLERLVGAPPDCPQSFGACTGCGFSPQPHHAVRRRDWVHEVLANLITDGEIVEEYGRVIDTGVRLRNKIAHIPLFDRSTYPELSPGERRTYGVDRALEEFERDAHALQSLLISLSVVARYLLLDRAFGTRIFMGLRPLNVVLVGGGG